MKPFKPRTRNRPEQKIQNAIVKLMQDRGWMAKNTHGNAYQSGFPDLYCHHPIHGYRWVEVKNPNKFHLTKDQKHWFPIFTKHGAGIWILVAASDYEYNKLFKPPNWHLFLGRSRV